MPFQSYTRCGAFRFTVQLNVNVICEELEIMLGGKYTEGLGAGSKFWLYVYKLEDEYEYKLNSHPKNPIPFWEWFFDNWNSFDEWENIEEHFEAEDEDEDEEDSQRV
jgi:hypothetical protein